MKILWIFGYHESSGYARNSREFIKAFNANGIETKFLIEKGTKYPDKEEIEKFAITREELDNFNFDVVIQNVIPPCFKRIGKVKNILMTVAETDRVSHQWIDYCNQADELWTMSYFSAASFITSGLRIPHFISLMPLDIEKIKQSKSDMFTVKKKDNTFIFFANSEWTPRKGWDILLDAYFSEFKNEDNVCLLIKTCCFSQCENSASIANEIKAFKQRYDAKCQCIVINEILPIEDVWSLNKQADAFVLPSRGEGCGIGYLESMALSRPVIAPSKGGQVDYFIPGASFPVSSKITQAFRFPHNPNYDETMRWITTDASDLRRNMRLAKEMQSRGIIDPKAYTIFEERFGIRGSEIKKSIERLMR